MTSHASETTDSTHAQTTRRRTLTALTSTTTAIIATAGCLTGNSSDNTTNSSDSDEDTQIPDTFDRVTVGTYELTIDVANPEELDSIALRRPTSGVIDRQQVQGTHTFPLMESVELYDPGEFVVEAKAGSNVVAEHTLEIAPDLQITEIELVKESGQEKLTSTRGENEGTTCAEKPHQHLFTIENRGSGPAALGKLKAELPEDINGYHRSRWETPSYIECHSRARSEWTTDPVLAPGQRLTFAPVWSETGYRSQTPSDEYTVPISVLENASEDWFSQDVELTFIEVADGNLAPVFEVRQDTEN